MGDSDNEYGSGSATQYGGVSQNTSISFDSGGSVSQSPSGEVRDITTANFMSAVIEDSSNQPILVDFWAPWCNPCKQLTPILEKAVAKTAGKVKLVKMDIEAHPEVAGQMGIQSIPAVVAFVNGRPADAFMGVQTETEIAAFIEKLAGPSEPDQSKLMLEEAAKLAASGATAEAANLYAAILQAEPDNLVALAGLGQLYLRDNNVDAVRGLISGLSEEQCTTLEIASLATALELAEQAESVGDFQDLQNAVDADPDNYQVRFDLAIALNGACKREEAADHLLEIIKKNSGWNDEAARKQLLQFFEAWGMTDEHTVAARRKLSAILFS